MSIFHSSDYPDRWHKEAPRLFQAALEVHCTALGVLHRSPEEQERDVALLKQALGDIPVPSEFSEFHNCAHVLFYQAIMDHEMARFPEGVEEVRYWP